MRNVRTRIFFLLLSAIYIAATTGTIALQFLSPVRAMRPPAVAPAEEGRSGAMFWTARRHLPVVREFSLSVADLPKVALPPILTEYRPAPPVARHERAHSLYYSSLSDRAPPTS